MAFRDPEDWTDEEIERRRAFLGAIVYRDDNRRYIPRVEWEQLGRWQRLRDRIRGREPIEGPYDRAVRARQARQKAAADQQELGLR